MEQDITGILSEEQMIENLRIFLSNLQDLGANRDFLMHWAMTYAIRLQKENAMREAFWARDYDAEFDDSSTTWMSTAVKWVKQACEELHIE